MARRHRERPRIEDHAVAALSGVLPYEIINDPAEITDNQVREDSRVLKDFLKLLMAMDAKQNLGGQNVSQ